VLSPSALILKIYFFKVSKNEMPDLAKIRHFFYSKVDLNDFKAEFLAFHPRVLTVCRIRLACRFGLA